MRRVTISKILLLAGLAVGAAGLVSCGGSNPTTPLPPSVGSGGGGYGSIGGALEAPPPGTPLLQTQNKADAFFALANNLSGYGDAVVTSQSRANYAIESTYQGTNFRNLGTSSGDVIQTSSFQVSGQGSGYSDSFSLRLSPQGYNSQDGGSYHFSYQVNVYGITLFSTDQVALFESDNRQGDILKVAYRSPSPTIARYVMQSANYQNNYGPYQSQYGGMNQYQSQVPQIIVVQQTITTNWPQRAQQNNGGYQQPGYGGGYPQQGGYGGGYPQQGGYGGGYPQSGGYGGGPQQYPGNTFIR